MNRLQFFNGKDAEGRAGFRDILVTEDSHPYIANWWPPGNLIGYEHSFVHTIADFVKAVVRRKNIAPNFADGLANQQVLAAVVESARTKRWVRL
ncbi:MAG TPA: hypothetical protein VGG02_03660 [Chthoniobacterales bacterium]|jgi:predicted dehydrogenase